MMKQAFVPTLSDVARLAGVSVATASRALSNPDLVAEHTRDLVRQAAESCGYRINLVARSLRTRRSNTVLVLIPDINNEFYPEIICGMEHHAHDMGYSVILGMTGNALEREESYYELLSTHRIDGLVILDGGIDRLLENGIHPSLPTVQVLECTGGTSLPFVRIDDHAVMEIAIAHLVGLGHRRIAHIAGSADSLVAHERIEGFRTAMKSRDLAVPPDLVKTGDYHHDGGRTAMQALLGLTAAPTAVICANDASALGAIQACQLAGLHVPHDMSVMGIDDITSAAQSAPQLTTIRQPRRAIGQRAMEILIEMMHHNRNIQTQVVMPTELVLRQSTAAPAA